MPPWAAKTVRQQHFGAGFADRRARRSASSRATQSATAKAAATSTNCSSLARLSYPPTVSRGASTAIPRRVCLPLEPAEAHASSARYVAWLGYSVGACFIRRFRTAVSVRNDRWNPAFRETDAPAEGGHRAVDASADGGCQRI